MDCLRMRRKRKQNELCENGNNRFDEGSRIDIPAPKQGAGKVTELNKDNFHGVLKQKDVALVLFHLPQDSDSHLIWKHFVKASTMTEKQGHVFAVVDCDVYGGFCVDEGILNLPTFMMYSNDKKLDFNPDRRNFKYKDMKIWVETFDSATCSAV